MSTQDFDEIISTHPNGNIEEEEREVTEITDQHVYESHYGLVNFNMQRKMISSGENIPSCNIGDVNIAGKPKNLHLGTKIIINGPLTVPEESRRNIYEINEDDDNNTNVDREEDAGLEDTYTRIGRLNLGLQLIKRKSYILFNKYLLVFMAFLLIEIIIVIFYFTISSRIKVPSDITELRLSQIGKNISHFKSRKNDWGTDNVCSVSCPLKRKTKIRLVVPETLLFTCSIMPGSDCQNEFVDNFNSYRKSPIPFNDIYYNYIVGMQGNIYEARSLTCSYNDHIFDKDNHDETLVIGVSFCFPKKSEANIYKTSNEIQAIVNLLDSLQRNEILGAHYEFQLLRICKGSLIDDELRRKNYDVTFYDNDYKNVSTKMSHKVEESLLFQKYDDTLTKNSVIQASSSLYQNKTCPNNSTKNRSITVRLLYAEQLNITFQNICDKFVNCTSIMEQGMKNHKIKISQFNINYFAFMLKPTPIFRFYKLDCSPIMKNNQILISILIDLPADKMNPQEYFPLLSELLHPITTEVNDFIQYDDVNFQFLCDKKSVPDKDSYTYYEFFSNVSYVKFEDLENPSPDCVTSPARYLRKFN